MCVYVFYSMDFNFVLGNLKFELAIKDFFNKKDKKICNALSKNIMPSKKM
jgi:hypothetical protein